MKNKMTDLHNHLFATLEALQDPENPMEIDRAKTVAEVAKVLVDAARVEVEMVKARGARGGGTGFIQLPADDTPPRAAHQQLGAGAPPAVQTETATPLRTCEACSQRTKMDPCNHCGVAWNRETRARA
jgi:hypothetical protein